MNNSNKNLLPPLYKRRSYAFYALITALGVALGIHFFYTFNPLTLLDLKTQYLLAYALILYKIIELYILHYIFYKRHYYKDDIDFVKNAKKLFFLIPQGNIVFGIVTYKLTGEFLFFILFIVIGLITLFMVDPKKREGLLEKL